MTQPFDNRLTSQSGDGLPAAPAGPTTLADRVRSLRLPESSGPARPRGSWLPWVLCGLLLLTTLVFGYRAFTAGPPKSAEQAKPQGPGGTAAAAGSGDVAL